MISESTLITRKLVHQAFKRLHDSQALGDHPLAALGIVSAHRASAGYADTPSGRSLALRAVLREAVISLRPEGDEDGQDRRWRQFVILSERYLNRRSPDSIADRLGIARSTYDHDHADALDAVAGVLQHMADSRTVSAAPQPTLPFMAPALPHPPMVGRHAELARLHEMLSGGAQSCAVAGLPGIGKTTLAVTLAHSAPIRDRFSGVLWSNLGRSPDLTGQLTAWGLALGLRLDEIGHLSQGTLAGALRAIIGAQDFLIVLDDVWSVEDAVAISIGGPGCRYLATTRLPAVAIDLAGDHALHLSELVLEDARALLGELVPELIAADPAGVDALAEAAGGLPMTLNLMGRHLRRESRVGGSARRLRGSLENLFTPDARLQLAEPVSLVEGGHGVPRSLMGMIALSAGVLSEESANALLALSLFPPKPNTFSETAALEISAAPSAALDSLVDAGLVSAAGDGRYSMHRAISDYAVLRLESSPAARQSAATRMIACFDLATTSLTPNQSILPDAETENVLAALDLAQDAGADDVFIRMLNAVYPSLEMRGLFARARRLLEIASQRIDRAAQPTVASTVLGNLGRIAVREGNIAEAAKLFRAGLALLEDTHGDDSQRIALVAGLGIAAIGEGSYDEARTLLEEALHRAQDAKVEPRISALLANLGTLELARGDIARAETLLSGALESARRLGDRIQSGAVLANLGVLAARRQDYLSAETCFEESLSLAHQVGNRESMSSLLTNIGALASERGDDAAAAACFDQALGLAREMGQRDRLCQLLANQSALAIRRGDLDAARAMLAEGLEIAHAINHHEHTILLLANSGALAEAEDDAPAALAHYRTALDRAQEHGLTRYIQSLRQQIEQLTSGGPVRLTA